MRRAVLLGAAVLTFFIAPFISFDPALAQFKQQGQKLVGTGAVGGSEQGYSVALSADGNTAIVGGLNDNSFAGAAWVFTRTNGVWSQQGEKLVGSGAVGAARQGVSVALSADGNTAIIGGFADNSFAGAAWVFTRTNGVWKQQHHKLVGTGAVGNAAQGASVALSADGNTAILGGDGDNSHVGAVWIFTRTNGVWSQQGEKLVGTGATGSSAQGFSVALSADGNTALIGGLGDGLPLSFGAAWVFARSNGVWTQQGDKLIGSGAVGYPQQGYSVALSGDGNIAVVGGPLDNSSAGAVWVFVRRQGVWKQQNDKLVGSGAIGPANQGQGVSLSADGNTAVIGGIGDNSYTGATWVFKRAGGAWTQEGHKLIGSSTVGSSPTQGSSVALSADGNTAMVGGVGDNTQTGAAWVFVERPSITSVAPSTGPAAGGTAVTITGTNFSGANAVTIGGQPARSFKVKNSTTIIARTRAHAAGAVSVNVTTSAGSGNATKSFTYQ